MNLDDRKRFTLRLPPRLFMQLQDIASELGFTLNAFILQILQDWVESQEKRVGWENGTNTNDNPPACGIKEEAGAGGG